MEAYIGEYASGKSENAVNRALALHADGRDVTLVDLDTVEPFYTLRPIKRSLEAQGLHVIAWETVDTVGLGEAGSLLRADMRWALHQQGDVILDIGYGVDGAKTLQLLQGREACPELRIIAVINTSRPMTASVEDIVEYVGELGPVDALLNNTHLGDETNLTVIREGARLVEEASRRLGLPVEATAVDERFRHLLDASDVMNHSIRYLQRWMAKAYW
ncbi:hypothetical protein [Heliophilum fasciatum]|uniref:Uncharacterized protein n=1 Tax=Heliophilum fasciatum TaxID=35700 RepID=A0A4R2RVQ9_9FIRM|nr:hypothetical protein [Heliophilum fasciatum]MCW2276974.1 hypothetical protein [Heliophilum fasciatum]TCP68500.1 hypothetical protein EDD73_103132 [Heliophilum fasciatum]